MSGVEILGVAAGAVQLAQVTVAVVTSVSGLLIQIQDASRTLQSRLIQVQTLIEIARLVACMPQLQTVEIEAILRNFVEKEASSFRRIAKAVSGIVTERKIVGFMQRLEVEKSAFTLCITRIDSTLILDIDRHLETLRGDLEKFAQSVNDELPLIRTAVELLSINSQVSPTTSNLSIEKKTEACLASLNAIDQMSFISQLLSRSRGACRWILENQQYVSWLKSNKSDLLWITARPGHGKTTLAAHISEIVTGDETPQTQDSAISQKPPVVLFFLFRKSNQEADGTPAAALRTIITQLVRQTPDTLPIVLQRHDILSSRGAFEWSWENLTGIFRKILEHIRIQTRVYIILDAVDECEAESRQMILDWIRGLVEDSIFSMPTKTSRAILKLVVTSRPDESAFDHLSQFKTLEITSLDTANDMHALVRNQMEDFAQRRHLDIEVAQSITHFLEGNAHGMFLWVVLIMDELKRRDERLSDEVIATKLSGIPLTLIKTYEAILLTPSLSRRNDLWRIIRWLVLGRRGLTIMELETALCLETGVLRWHDFVGDINFLCGSLIRSDGPRGEINLVHQTAKEYLEKFTKNSSLEDMAGVDMDSIAGNAHLATICVQYLLRHEGFAELEKLLLLSRNELRYLHTVSLFLGRYPFICYAIEHWHSHVRAVGQPSPILSGMIQELLSSTTHRDGIMTLTYYINHHGSSNVPIHQDPLHLATYFNLPWLVKRYISDDQTFVDVVGTMNDTPLIWGPEMGSTECVKKLLDAGADPNNFEYDGWSALHWAARNGHLHLVELLLHSGARLNQRDIRGNSPLDWAMDREHWDVVSALKGRMTEQELTEWNDTQEQNSSAGTMNTRRFPDMGEVWTLRNFRQ